MSDGAHVWPDGHPVQYNIRLFLELKKHKRFSQKTKKFLYNLSNIQACKNTIVKVKFRRNDKECIRL